MRRRAARSRRIGLAEPQKPPVRVDAHARQRRRAERNPLTLEQALPFGGGQRHRRQPLQRRSRWAGAAAARHARARRAVPPGCASASPSNGSTARRRSAVTWPQVPSAPPCPRPARGCRCPWSTATSSSRLSVLELAAASARTARCSRARALDLDARRAPACRAAGRRASAPSTSAAPGAVAPRKPARARSTRGALQRRHRRALDDLALGIAGGGARRRGATVKR